MEIDMHLLTLLLACGDKAEDTATEPPVSEPEVVTEPSEEEENKRSHLKLLSTALRTFSKG